VALIFHLLYTYFAGVRVICIELEHVLPGLEQEKNYLSVFLKKLLEWI
jgi:hypothetical protein